MTTFNALYYPSWDPPVKWLRSMLLFFDRVEVIRPTDVDPQYDPANAEVFEKIPDVFGEIKRENYEMTMNVRNKKIIANNFKMIAHKIIRNKKNINLVIPDSGGISVPGYTFLHSSKIHPDISELLESNSLINHNVEKLLEIETGTVRLVEQNASKIVLSLIADYYAKQKNLRSITDEPIGYVINALNTNSLIRKEAAEMSLASAMLNVEIPNNIENLTPGQYVDLRKRYEDIREPFQHAVTELCGDCKLAQINSRRQFEDIVRDTTQNFREETKKLRKKYWAKRTKNYTVMGVGVLSSYCCLGAGLW